MNLIESIKLDNMTGKPVTRKITGLLITVRGTVSDRTYSLVAKNEITSISSEPTNGNGGELQIFLELEKNATEWECKLQINGNDVENQIDPNDPTKTIETIVLATQEIKLGKFKLMNPLELFDEVDQDQWWSTAASLIWAFDNDKNHQWNEEERANVWKLLEAAVIEGKKRRISVEQEKLNKNIEDLRNKIAYLEDVKNSVN